MNEQARVIADGLVDKLFSTWPKYQDNHHIEQDGWTVSVQDGDYHEPGRIETRHGLRREVEYSRYTWGIADVRRHVRAQVALLLG